MLIVPIQVLLVKVIENSKGSVGHIQGIEMNASDMMVRLGYRNIFKSSPRAAQYIVILLANTRYLSY